MNKFIMILAVLLLLCLLLTAGSVASTNKQISRYLAMSSSLGIVPDNVQAAVTELVPIGTPKQRVVSTLVARNIGRDANSACVTSPNLTEIICSLGIDHHFWDLLRETYTICFAFDSSETLKKVSVRSKLDWLSAH